ncbi:MULTISPECIES: glycosyltransferase [Ralstonia]|jgi:glycosyltransferase involved in cell wall biosynthesis|uniref:Glycosyltransferase n=2 Tax=Pseudomonadota TaxID=1224 RepID=R0E8F4_RALPI|nr:MULTISPECIES: glycosyltransferase [Ralstonia]ENZ78429.1 glycosyltransferase [Ralstonia pickettii OR214]MCM3580966.1 glycosyltransferase [Ralstonia pickettii]MEA3267552.1 glycosyltransferase [Pseudomonadota bacterium]OYU22609.1 MAG: glycosyl transferase family 1 [Ralstonia sp. PBBBR1]
MADIRLHQPQPMRILLLTTGLKLGGAEQQVAALARQFVALEHTVAVVSLTPGSDVALPEAVTVVPLEMHKTPQSMVRALWKLRAFVRQWQPDIIHAHMVHANLLARVLAATGDMPPVICTAHSAREGGGLRMLGYRLTDRWSHLNTHVSPQGRQAMIEAGAVSSVRITVVPNGIDTAQFRPDTALRQRAREALGLQDSTRLLINVGRLVKEKAQATLIDAFSQLEADSDTQLLIVGDGPLRGALEQQIRDRRLTGRIRLTGARSDIPALLNGADLFVLSSDIEGMPLALGEALACGLPVVATDAAGVAELLGEYGEIVPRGDPTALAAAMHRALACGLGDADAQAARRAHIASRFSLEAVALEWLGRYASLIGTDRAASARVAQ